MQIYSRLFVIHNPQVFCHLHYIQVFGVKKIIFLAVTGGGLCAECDKPAKLRCADCKNNTCQMVFYCSKECKRANLPHHKNFCSLPIPLKMLTGPSNFFWFGIITFVNKCPKNTKKIDLKVSYYLNS
jgi:hypothetical protein